MSDTDSEGSSVGLGDEETRSAVRDFSREEPESQEESLPPGLAEKRGRITSTSPISREVFNDLVTQLVALIIGVEFIDTGTKFYDPSEVESKFSQFVPAISLAEKLYVSLDSDPVRFKENACERLQVIKKVLTDFISRDLSLFGDFVDSVAVLILNHNVMEFERASTAKERKAKKKKMKSVSSSVLVKGNWETGLVTYNGKESGRFSVEIIADALQAVLDSGFGIRDYIARIDERPISIMFNAVPVSEEFSSAVARIIKFITIYGKDKKKDTTFKLFRDKFHDKALKKDKKSSMAYDRCLIEGLSRSYTDIVRTGRIYALYIHEVIPNVTSNKRRIHICSLAGDFFKGVLPKNYNDLRGGFAAKFKKVENSNKLEVKAIYTALEVFYLAVKKWISKGKKAETMGSMYSLLIKLSQHFRLADYYDRDEKKSKDIYRELFLILNSGLKREVPQARLAILKSISEDFLVHIPESVVKKSSDRNIFARHVRRYLIPGLFPDLRKAPSWKDEAPYIVDILVKCGTIELSSISEFTQENLFNEKVCIENRIIIINMFSRLSRKLPKEVKQYKSAFSERIYQGISYSKRGENGLLWSGELDKDMKKLFNDNGTGIVAGLIGGYAGTFPSIIHSEKAKKVETIERIIELALSEDEELSTTARSSISQFVSLSKRKNHGNYFSIVAGILYKKVLERYDWIFSMATRQVKEAGALGKPANVVKRMLQLVRDVYSSLERYVSRMRERDISGIRPDYLAYLRAKTESLLILFSLYPDEELMSEIDKTREFLLRKELMDLEQEVLSNMEENKKNIPESVRSIVKDGLGRSPEYYVKRFSKVGPEHSWVWNSACSLVNHPAVPKVLSNYYVKESVPEDDAAKKFIQSVYILVNSSLILPPGDEIDEKTHKVERSAAGGRRGYEERDDDSESESSSSFGYSLGGKGLKFHLSDVKIKYSILERYFENLHNLLGSDYSIFKDYAEKCASCSSPQMVVAMYDIFKTLPFSLEPAEKRGKLIPAFYTDSSVLEFLLQLFGSGEVIAAEISHIASDYFLVWINNKSIFDRKPLNLVSKAMDVLAKFITYVSNLKSSKSTPDISEERSLPEESNEDRSTENSSKARKAVLFKTIARKPQQKQLVDIMDSSDSEDSEYESSSEEDEDDSVSESQTRSEAAPEFSLFRQSIRNEVQEFCIRLISNVITSMDKEYKKRKRNLRKSYKNGDITKEEYISANPRMPEDREKHRGRIAMIKSLLGVLAALTRFRGIDNPKNQIKVVNVVLKYRPELMVASEDLVLSILNNHGKEVLSYVCLSAISFLSWSDNYHISTCHLRSLTKYVKATTMPFSSDPMHCCFVTGVVSTLSRYSKPSSVGASLAALSIRDADVSKQHVSAIFGEDKINSVRRFLAEVLERGLDPDYFLGRILEWRDYLDSWTLDNVVLALSPVLLYVIRTKKGDVDSTLKFLTEIGVECLDDEKMLNSFNGLILNFATETVPKSLETVDTWFGSIFGKVVEILKSENRGRDSKALRVYTNLTNKLSRENESAALDFLLKKIEEDYIADFDPESVSMKELWNLMENGSSFSDVEIERDAAYYILYGFIKETPLIGYDDRLSRTMQACLVFPYLPDSAPYIFNAVKTALKSIGFRSEDNIFLLLDDVLRRSWSKVALRWLVSFLRREKSISEGSLLVYSKTKIGKEISEKDAEIFSALLLYSLKGNIVVTRDILKFLLDNKSVISELENVQKLVMSICVCLTSNDRLVYEKSLQLLESFRDVKSALQNSWNNDGSRTEAHVLDMFFKGFLDKSAALGDMNLRLFGTFLSVVGRSGFVGATAEKVHLGDDIEEYSLSGMWYLCLYLVRVLNSEIPNKAETLERLLLYLLDTLRYGKFEIDDEDYVLFVKFFEYLSFSQVVNDGKTKGILSSIFQEVVQIKGNDLIVNDDGKVMILLNVYGDPSELRRLMEELSAKILPNKGALSVFGDESYLSKEEYARAKEFITTT